MHHVRKLKIVEVDLNPKVKALDKIIIARRRKQIPVCRECYMKIHHP